MPKFKTSESAFFFPPHLINYQELVQVLILSLIYLLHLSLPIFIATVLALDLILDYYNSLPTSLFPVPLCQPILCISFRPKDFLKGAGVGGEQTDTKPNFSLAHTFFRIKMSNRAFTYLVLFFLLYLSLFLPYARKTAFPPVYVPASISLCCSCILVSSTLTHLTTNSHLYPWVLFILQAQFKIIPPWCFPFVPQPSMFFLSSKLLLHFHQTSLLWLLYLFLYKLLRVWIISFHTWTFYSKFQVPRYVLRIRDTKINQI